MIPVGDRTVGASSRNYRFSANVQVSIDADTKLVVATARPTPSNRADARVWRESVLAEQCQGVTVLDVTAADEHTTLSVMAGLEQW